MLILGKAELWANPAYTLASVFANIDEFVSTYKSRRIVVNVNNESIVFGEQLLNVSKNVRDKIEGLCLLCCREVNARAWKCNINHKSVPTAN